MSQMGSGNATPAPSGMVSSNTTTPSSLTTTGTNLTPQPTPSSGGLTFDDVENYWIQAGGSPQAAAMAAAIASASSGLNPGTTRTNPDGTCSVGLWLIPQNGMPPGTTDPLSNARAAVQLSSNGTDWSQWCVAWSDNNCGENGGTYLGSGSNALGALGSTNEPYNVYGATPSGSGVGASAATSTSPTTGQSNSSNHIAIYIGVALLAIVIAVYFGRKHGTDMTAETGPDPTAGMNNREVVVPAHVRRMPAPDSEGPYRPRNPQV